MQTPLIGSHPALDFLNTAFAPDGQLIETIGDGRALMDWLVATHLVPQTAAAALSRRLGAKGLDAMAAEVRKMREWARSWLERWRAAPKRDYSEEIAHLNRLLARATYKHSVVATKEGLAIEEQTSMDSADAIVALLAQHIAELVTQEDPSLVKSCAGSGCTLWFLDRTKAHRRLFCSPATCGNRAKVAAFRERQR